MDIENGPAATLLTPAELAARWRLSAKKIQRMAHAGTVTRVFPDGAGHPRYLLRQVQEIEAYWAETARSERGSAAHSAPDGRE